MESKVHVRLDFILDRKRLYVNLVLLVFAAQQQLTQSVQMESIRHLVIHPVNRVQLVIIVHVTETFNLVTLLSARWDIIVLVVDLVPKCVQNILMVLVSDLLLSQTAKIVQLATTVLRVQLVIQVRYTFVRSVIIVRVTNLDNQLYQQSHPWSNVS